MLARERSRADGVLVWEWGHAAEVLARERSHADGVQMWERSRADGVLIWERSRADEVLVWESTSAAWPPDSGLSHLFCYFRRMWHDLK